METKPTNWRLNYDHANHAKFKKFAAAYPREYNSLVANLSKIMGLLEDGSKVGGFHVNFFRSEKEGVYRIGQTAVESAKESRLYVYPDQQNQVMYVILAGTKDQQSADITEAVEAARKIRETSKKD